MTPKDKVNQLPPPCRSCSACLITVDFQTATCAHCPRKQQEGT